MELRCFGASRHLIYCNIVPHYVSLPFDLQLTPTLHTHLSLLSSSVSKYLLNYVAVTMMAVFHCITLLLVHELYYLFVCASPATHHSFTIVPICFLWSVNVYHPLLCSSLLFCTLVICSQFVDTFHGFQIISIAKSNNLIRNLLFLPWFKYYSLHIVNFSLAQLAFYII